MSELNASERSTVAKHFADLVAVQRSQRSTPTASVARPAAPLTAHLCGGSKELLEHIDVALSAPTDTPQTAAMAVLSRMYLEAASSATRADRDPLRFSESALVISACDAFVDHTKGFCKTLEASLTASAPWVAQTKNRQERSEGDLAGGTAGAEKPPRRGGDKGIVPAWSGADDGGADRLGQGSDVASSSLQTTLLATRRRLDSLSSAVGALLNHCVQLESSLRAATSFRQRVAEVVARCHGQVVGGAHGRPSTAAGGSGVSPALLQATTPERDALVRAAVRECETDLEYRVEQRFMAHAKAQVAAVLERHGIVDGMSVTVDSATEAFEDILDTFHHRWRQHWVESRRELQNEVNACSQAALKALAAARRLLAAGSPVPTVGDAAEPVSAIDSRRSSGKSSTTVALRELAPSEQRIAPLDVDASQRVGLSSQSALSDRMLVAQSPLRPPSRQQSASASRPPSRSSASPIAMARRLRDQQHQLAAERLAAARQSCAEADGDLFSLRASRPMVPSSSPLIESTASVAGTMPGHGRPGLRASTPSPASALQRKLRHSGSHRGGVPDVGSAAITTPLISAKRTGQPSYR